MIVLARNTKRALSVAFPCTACDKKQTFTWREEERKGEGRTNSKALILTSNVHVKYKFCLSVRKTIEGGGGERGEREREREMERERRGGGGREGGEAVGEVRSGGVGKERKLQEE